MINSEAIESLKKLKDGNIRFVNGNAEKPNQSLNRLKEISSIQTPFATIIGCSDSRVPSEIIFDQGLGDLFIVRTAGQVSSNASWASVEFAYTALNTKLIVVLGHTKCGAVKAACESNETVGHMVTLINEIKPAVVLAKNNLKDGNLVELAVEYNVLLQVEKLKLLEPILSKAVESSDLLIIGAVYELETGEVKFLE